MKKIRPLWRKLAYCLIGLVVLVFAGNMILNHVIEQKIKSQLSALAPYANVSFTAAHANLFKFSLSMQGLNIAFHADTTIIQHAHTIQFKDAEFIGINFFKILFNKKLGISTLKLAGGTITLDSLLLYKKDLPHYDLLARIPFKTVDIGRITITQAALFMQTGTATTPLMKTNLSIDNIHVSHDDKAGMSFSGIACNMQDIHYTIPGLNHALQIQRLVINSRKKTVRADSLQIIPQGETTGLRVKALIPLFSIEGFDILKAQAGKFIAEKISINNSSLHAGINGELKDVLRPFSKHIQQYAQDVQVDSFKISHSVIAGNLDDATLSQKAGADMLDSALPANLSIKNVTVTSTKFSLQQDGKKECTVDNLYLSNIKKVTGKNMQFGEVECGISGISSAIPGLFNTLHIGTLALSSKKAVMRAENIKLVPQYGKFELGNKLGHQADYIEGSVAGVEITGLDIQGLLHKKLLADKIVVSKSAMLVFRDRRLPRPTKVQLLPADYLKTIPIQLNVKLVQVKNSSLAYEEFPKDGKQTGTLKVVNLNMQLSPLVNKASSATDHIDTHVDASIMGSGTVEATIDMPLNSGQDYHVKGVIKNLELTALQSSAENLGKFHIESGLLNTLFFEFAMNNEKARGKIIGEYHNLVIEKLKGQDKKIAWVPTFALKNIIIPKNKDKSKPGANRTGKIDYKHDPTRFASFYLVKALLDGIRDSFTLGFLLPK